MTQHPIIMFITYITPFVSILGVALLALEYPLYGWICLVIYNMLNLIVYFHAGKRFISYFFVNYIYIILGIIAIIKII